MTDTDNGRWPGPAWQRSGVQVVGVDFPERTIDLIVIPYDVETEVRHPTKPNGPKVTEVITRGAFNGIQRRANRVKANRDHDEARTFGKATAFHPDHEKGLHAKIRVARTPLGDETLELADAEILDVSAGFWPGRDGLQWETQTRYRINKAILHHVALVPDGQYGENAGVLAVRAADPSATQRFATPVMDALDLQRWLDLEAQINARFTSAGRHG